MTENGPITWKEIRAQCWWLLYAAAFSIPLHKKWIPAALAVMAVGLLIGTSWKERTQLFLERKRWIGLFSALYLVHLVGMSYSANQAYGWFDMEVKLSMLIMPLLLLTTAGLNVERITRTMIAFVAGCLAGVLTSYGLALWHFLETEDASVFYYAELSAFHHPTYFSMYLNLAVAMLMHWIFQRKDQVRILHFVLLCAFLITIYQLSSRTGILSLIGLLIFTFVYYVYPRLRWWKSFLALLATVAVAALVIYNSNYAMKRFEFARQAILEQKEELKESSSAIRLSIWKQSLVPISEHWLFGVGTGDVKDELISNYRKIGLDSAADRNLNAHNQYIQFQLALGIPGTLALILGLLIPFWQSVRKRFMVYGLFLFVIGLNLLTESALETQAGVVFYAFFNALLFVQLLNSPTEIVK